MGKMIKLIKRIFHRHNWYYLEYNEWASLGRKENCICTRCGERRYWADT